MEWLIGITVGVIITCIGVKVTNRMIHKIGEEGINYIQDTEKFWQAHKESRDAIDRDIENRPLSEQRVIMAKMRANHAAMRNAKKLAQ